MHLHPKSFSRLTILANKLLLFGRFFCVFYLKKSSQK